MIARPNNHSMMVQYATARLLFSRPHSIVGLVLKSISIKCAKYCPYEISAWYVIIVGIHEQDCSIPSSFNSCKNYTSSLQEQEAGSSVFSFATEKPTQLPIMDVNVWLGRDSVREAMAVELGPVCFTH